MRNIKSYSGVVVPMITPFDDQGKIDLHAIEKIMNNFIHSKIDPLLLGTTGESASIYDEDKLNIVKFVTHNFGKRSKIYAVISENCFQKSVEFAKQYYDLGVELIVALLPSYYPLNDLQIRKYFEDLAESIPGKLFIYNIPATTRISIPLNIIDDLSKHEKIVGVKDSEQNIERLNESINLWKDREDFSHFIGWGAQCFNGLWLGSDGIVPSTGNFSPTLYKEMYEAVLNDEKEKGEYAQNVTMEIASVYQKDKILSESLPALKVMMSQIGLCNTTVIPPFTELPKEEEKIIRYKTKEIITKYKSIRELNDE